MFKNVNAAEKMTINQKQQEKSIEEESLIKILVIKQVYLIFPIPPKCQDFQ